MRCPYCSAEYAPRSRGQVTCGADACRKAHSRRNHPDRERINELKREAGAEVRERIVGLLTHLGNEEREAAEVARLLEPVPVAQVLRSERRAREEAKAGWKELASTRPGRMARPSLVDAEDEVDREVLACFRDQERCGK